MTKNLDKINWQKIDLPKAEFILKEAEKLMSNVSENYDKLDSKVVSMRTFLMSGISAMAALLAFADNKYDFVFITLLCGFCISLVILSVAHKAKPFPTVGTMPNELAKEKYNKNDLTFLISSQLQTYNIRIQDAKELNQAKKTHINWSINIVVSSFIIATAILVKILICS